MLLFGIEPVYVWVIVLIVTIALEAFTLNLVSVWFAVGALASLIAASCGMSLVSQLILFVSVSAVLLLLVRPFTRKFLKTKEERTNADRILGQTAIVTEEINNRLSQGQIKLMGQTWSARSTDDAILPVETTVKVLSISGVKAIVEKAET